MDNTALSQQILTELKAFKSEFKELKLELKEFKSETNARFDKMDARFDKIDVRLEKIEADIVEIKDHAEVTRDVVNTIGHWVELASDSLKIEYPVDTF